MGPDEPDELDEGERLPAFDYGLPDLPDALDGEDLQSLDPADVEHWVSVYTQLVAFTRSVLAPATEGRPEGRAGGGPEDAAPASEEEAFESQLMVYRAMVQELHLAYWSDRLSRLRMGSDR